VAANKKGAAQAAPSKATGAKAGKARPKAKKPDAVRPDAFCLSLAQKRKLAKDAMWASLAVLTLTSFTGVHRHGPSRTLHIASGAALIGLTLWHHTLYGRKAAQCPAPEL
jgi:hypothetical protein